ncbi:class I SAM-dependent methyltransferase [Catalinimonas niigatensis]|uniref:class I SAM-dependent methyltransferase n=1 Tax=Catalinimonas niigatensis TaxID=1397264 RepID=UPI002666B34D|nr:methyltransferase domain-containing protein [Catalinimonas niigatensis]WPP52631.1 methyltransferase domain-containing protein [Catalinimonas niigatensis]
MKLHLGSGKNIKEGYINIDAYVKHPGIENLDIFDLPYDDKSIDEILTEHLIEHIGFKDEEKFWRECYRLLKPKGKLICESPDLEWLCKVFIENQDDFKEFYKVGAIDHYFGNGKSVEHRWGILTTHLFGNQNGPGQFHYNGFTKGKFYRIAEIIGFSEVDVIKLFNKGAQCLRVTYVK